MLGPNSGHRCPALGPCAGFPGLGAMVRPSGAPARSRPISAQRLRFLRFILRPLFRLARLVFCGAALAVLAFAGLRRGQLTTSCKFALDLGNVFRAPAWFVAGMPTVALDGELWIGRGQFQRTVAVVTRHDGGEAWQSVRFMVFDAPHAPGGFESRLAYASKAIEHATHAVLHAHQPCLGREELLQSLAAVESLGGEGLMLRKSGSKYFPHRSFSLLKVKSFHDADAVVVGYRAGDGQHSGATGALVVKTEGGVEFALGSGLSLEQRLNPPALGALVAFRYQGVTASGIPRFAVFLGVRAERNFAVKPSN
jgi:DNA ligase 1